MYRVRTYFVQDGSFVTEEILGSVLAAESISNVHIERIAETSDGVLVETNNFARFYVYLG